MSLDDTASAPTTEPPDAFDSYEFVLLLRPEQRPELDEEHVEQLQRLHLGHLEAMRAAGHLVVAGPLEGQPDERWRGICVYRVGSIEEARSLAEQDPAVRAGQLRIEAMRWLTRKGALRAGD